MMDPRTEELIIATEERTDPNSPNIPEEGTDSIPPWHAEVFLPETTSLPPLAVRIVRSKIVRRNSLTVVPREVVCEPVIALLPGIFAQNSADREE